MKTQPESAGVPGRKAGCGSHRQPEQTRAAILDAAIREFAVEGIEGARTEAIARAACVNKALLYYYFQDKETLYGAVLDRAFGAMRATVAPVLESDLPPRKKLLAYASAHFDYISNTPLLPRLMMREVMRAARGPSQLDRIAEKYSRPTIGKLIQVVKDGIASGDFRPVDPAQFVLSMLAITVFYFGATPMLRLLSCGDPLAPENIATRRAAVLDFISAALFTNSNPKGARP